MLQTANRLRIMFPRRRGQITGVLLFIDHSTEGKHGLKDDVTGRSHWHQDVHEGVSFPVSDRQRLCGSGVEK